MSAGLVRFRKSIELMPWFFLVAVAGATQALVVNYVPANPVVKAADVPEYFGNSLDPRVVRRFLGVRLVAADFIWIDALIKADIARTPESNAVFAKVFKTLVTLDPDNMNAYWVGGLYLSVIKDDVKAATSLLRDGIRQMESLGFARPGAWKVPFALGYNLMFEEHEFEEGAKWARLAGEAPDAPPYVKMLAEKVGSETGMFQVAANVLGDLHRRARSPEERARIEEKMTDLAARQELTELNQKFQEFLRSTGAYAFPKSRQFLLFMKSIGRPHKDLRGRPLKLNQAGKIVTE